ncbi:uncharacterized protein LOC102800583, partial [Saccoglossus kowalevskii]|uniref:Uncharacterized protein LOC102800583 n=1 Tax=Saccoglossus kowalevskii TaxID=10224 RepID=A0ABM0M316_SACKO
IPRCYKSNDFGKLKRAELHHFSDASQHSYGQCSYLRLIDEHDKVSCSLVMGKSRVTPSKPITIPRLEVTAAVTSVQVYNFLNKELQYENITHTFWTDSKQQSCRLGIKELIQSSLWWKGPEFLSTAEILLPTEGCAIDLEANDPEVKKVTVLTTQVKPECFVDILTRLQYFSSWHKAKRAIAVCLRLKQKLQNRSIKFPKKQ